MHLTRSLPLSPCCACRNPNRPPPTTPTAHHPATNRMPDGAHYMPVLTDSFLFKAGAAWQFPAFVLCLGSSYLQRMLERLPHLASAALSCPGFEDYCAHLQHKVRRAAGWRAGWRLVLRAPRVLCLAAERRAAACLLSRAERACRVPAAAPAARRAAAQAERCRRRGGAGDAALGAVHLPLYGHQGVRRCTNTQQAAATQALQPAAALQPVAAWAHFSCLLARAIASACSRTCQSCCLLLRCCSPTAACRSRTRCTRWACCASC